MVRRTESATIFEPEEVIAPIYTGGDVALSADGQLLASCLGEDVLLTDFDTGQRLARINGDGETVTSMCLTPSASHVAICSRSLALRIYPLNRSNGALTVGEPRNLKSQALPLVKSAIDSTGSLLAAGSSDGSVRVWDIREGYATHTLHSHGSVVSCLLFFQSPSKRNESTAGYRLAAGFEDGKLRTWNLDTRKSSSFLDSHVSAVSCMDYDPASNTLLTASRDRTVMLWDVASWQLKITIPALELVETAGFLSSTCIYTAGEKGQVRLWKTTGQSMTPQDKRASAGVVQAVKCTELSCLVVAYANQVLQMYSVTNSEQGTELQVTRTISGTHDEVIDLAFVGLDQSMLAIATNVEEIKVLSLRSSKADNQYFGADICSMKGHNDIVICLDVDWSGHWLVSGAKDNSAKLWRLVPSTQSFECYSTFTGHAESIGAIALPKRAPREGTTEFESPWDNPPKILITGSQDKTVKRWDISSSTEHHLKQSRAFYTRKAHDKDINAVDINHNSTIFASASQDRTVKIWSIEDGETIGVLRGHRRGVWSVRFSPAHTPPINSEGSQVAGGRGFVLTGSGDRTVKIWSLTDYSCLRTFEGHTNSVLKTVWLNLPSAESELQLDGDTDMDEEDGGVKSAKGKRGTQVASGAADGLVKVWDVGQGELATTMDNHTDRVWSLAVHPSTNGIVSGGGDSVITFWKDTTSTKLAAAIAQSSARVEQDQELQNFIRAGSYHEAVALALQLDHPGRLLGLFATVTSQHPPEPGSLCGSKAVDHVLRQLSDDQLLGLLARVRDWNTNAKTAPVAQRVLQTLLRVHAPARLLKLRSGKEVDVKTLLEGLRVYTERHFARMEELVDESYLVEYTLQEMETVSMANGITAPNAT